MKLPEQSPQIVERSGAAIAAALAANRAPSTTSWRAILRFRAKV